MKFIYGDVHWGIIGCGDVCEVKSGPAFSKITNSKLVAVMRRDLDKAKDYAARHHVERYYSNARELINDAEVNAIYIATPPASHEAYAIEAMAAGKPVYIEKPLTLNTNAAERILASSKINQVRVTGAYYRRELPLFKKIKELLLGQVIGDVRFIQINTLQSPTKNIVTKTEDNWRLNPSLSGGGLFHDLAPHQLDLMYWYFGKPINYRGRSVPAQQMQLAPEVTSLEVEFHGKIIMQGIWAFNVSEHAVKETCEIIGSKGKLAFSFFSGAELKIFTSDKNETLHFENPKHIQQPMIEKVVDFFKGKGENPCSVEDAIVSMKLLDCTL